MPKQIFACKHHWVILHMLTIEVLAQHIATDADFKPKKVLGVIVRLCNVVLATVVLNLSFLVVGR